MTADKLTITFPCQVVTMPPLALTDAGQQIVAESKFLTIPSKDGTLFLILFRELILLQNFASERLADIEIRPLAIETPDQLDYIIQMTSDHHGVPIGLLVDPYPNLMGYSIAPK